jgi:hypothetical protein
MSERTASMVLMCSDPEVTAGPVPLETDAVSAYMYSRRWFVENMRREGFIKLITDADTSVEFADFIESSEHHYAMKGDVPYAEKIEANLTNLINVDGFKQAGGREYGDFTDGELAAQPFVLAIKGEQRGVGKYLIENSGQVKTLRRYATDMLQGETGSLEVRPYLETPGPRFTSYRVITASTGAEGSILAAGLNVSAHSKSDRRIMIDPTRSQPLETPGDYFLEAADVRSNLSQGGFSIPLMGEGRQAWQPGTIQYDVLTAHGIDPSKPMLPDNIAERSRSVASVLGRATGIVQGQDYLQTSGDPTDNYFLENNSGPGLVTYQACHNPEGSWENAQTYFAVHASLLRHYVRVSYDLALQRY